MPRGPRLDAPGAVHHVMVRGINRRDIFEDNRDRRNLLGRLSDVLPESDCLCFAWVLMSNHFHLVVRTGRVPVGRVMARVGTGYAMYFNARYGRVGHLVQNRFKSRLVHDDNDLLNLIRYVHLNPVSAAIVDSLASLRLYPWSGYAALMGECPQAFHDSTRALALFAKDATTARRQLSRFMQEGIDGAPLTATEIPESGIQPLIREVCRSHGIDPAELIRGRRGAASRARCDIACRATVELRLSQATIAEAIGVSQPAVSGYLRRGVLVRDRDPEVMD